MTNRKNKTLILTEDLFSRCLSVIVYGNANGKLEIKFKLILAKFNQFQKVAGVISNSTLY